MLSLECKNCKSIAQLPSELLRDKLLGDILVDEKDLICFACRKSQWEVPVQADSFDFVQSVHKLRKYETDASIILQSIWRMLIVYRKYRDWLRDKQHRLYLANCATRIQIFYRKILSKRILMIKAYIKRIVSTTRMVRRRALSESGTYWYVGVQLDILSRDYMSLIRMTSYFPQRNIVEGNIAKLYKKVVAIEDENAVIIQKVARGEQDRKNVLILREVLAKKRRIEGMAVTLIALVYRKHVKRYKSMQRISERLRLQRLVSYKKERETNKISQNLMRYKHKILVEYRRFVDEDFVSQHLQKLDISNEYNSENNFTQTINAYINLKSSNDD